MHSLLLQSTASLPTQPVVLKAAKTLFCFLPLGFLLNWLRLGFSAIRNAGTRDRPVRRYGSLSVTPKSCSTCFTYRQTCRIGCLFKLSFHFLNFPTAFAPQLAEGADPEARLKGPKELRSRESGLLKPQMQADGEIHYLLPRMVPANQLMLPCWRDLGRPGVRQRGSAAGA